MRYTKSLLLLSILCSAKAQACDLCSSYYQPLSASTPVSAKSINLYSGVSEQFTSFGTDRIDGHEVANPTGEYLNSSITQLILGATCFNDRFSVQANLPMIYRSFRRPDGFKIDHGTVSGLGDISLSGNLVVLRKEALFHEAGLSKEGKSAAEPRGKSDLGASLNLSVALKLPTGDSSQLGIPEVEVEGAPESGIGNHDLTIGTGSVDVIFGMQGLIRYKSFFLQADAQFAWRGQGGHSYRYANDFTWSGGPGHYLYNQDDRTLAVQLVLSGETKGYDFHEGMPEPDTGITSLYVGPRILGAFGPFTAEVGIDLPVIMNTTAFQTTPDYRVRAGITYEF